MAQSSSLSTSIFTAFLASVRNWCCFLQGVSHGHTLNSNSNRCPCSLPAPMPHGLLCYSPAYQLSYYFRSTSTLLDNSNPINSFYWSWLLPLMFILPKKSCSSVNPCKLVVWIQSGVSKELCCAAGRRMLTLESFITALINHAIVSYCKLNLCHPEILKLGRFKYSANTCPVMGKNEGLWLMTLQAFGQCRAECLMLSPWTWGVSVAHPGNELVAGVKSCARGTFHFQQHPI